MKDVYDNLLPTDSAYFRAKNPEDWFWADIPTRLAAKRTTATEKAVFLLASQIYDQVPDIYGWAEYGPREEAVEPVATEADEARASLERARAYSAQTLIDLSG